MRISTLLFYIFGLWSRRAHKMISSASAISDEAYPPVIIGFESKFRLNFVLDHFSRSTVACLNLPRLGPRKADDTTTPLLPNAQPYSLTIFLQKVGTLEARSRSVDNPD